jgi:glycoside/pentoside/hexuronide:cation symporter, GPH family
MSAREESRVMSQATTPAASAPLPFRTKLSFGIGSAAEAIALHTVTAYAVLFYNQVLGLPAYLAGIAVSVSLVLDSIVEPLAGSMSDRTRSRWGRRHPFMYIAALPIALAFYAIFNPPAGLSHSSLFLWFLVTVSVMRWSMAFYHTPHIALGGELSRDYTERSKVMAYNSFFTWAGAALTTWIALTYFFMKTPEYPRGLLNPDAWSPYAATMATVAFLILMASAVFTHDRVPHLPQPAHDTPKFSPLTFFRDIKWALTNINYVWLLIGFFFLSITLGLRTVLHVYVNTFFWGLGSEELRLFIIGTFVGYATAFLMAARLHGRFDKRRTMIVAALTYAIVPAIPIALGMAGIMTADMPYLMVILVGFSMVSNGALSVLSISVMSALADVADENEAKHGVRQEGVLYSTRTLFAKVDQAIGTALAGLILTLIAFPEKAQPGMIPRDVLWNLALWDGIIAAVPTFAAAYFYGRYSIDLKAYQATRAAIAARRAAAAPAE